MTFICCCCFFSFAEDNERVSRIWWWKSTRTDWHTAQKSIKMTQNDYKTTYFFVHYEHEIIYGSILNSKRQRQIVFVDSFVLKKNYIHAHLQIYLCERSILNERRNRMKWRATTTIKNTRIKSISNRKWIIECGHAMQNGIYFAIK